MKGDFYALHETQELKKHSCGMTAHPVDFSTTFHTMHTHIISIYKK